MFFLDWFTGLVETAFLKGVARAVKKLNLQAGPDAQAELAALEASVATPLALETTGDPRPSRKPAK